MYASNSKKKRMQDMQFRNRIKFLQCTNIYIINISDYLLTRVLSG